MHASLVEDNLALTTASLRRYEEWPPGRRQLTALRAKTRLYPGFEPSRIDLLVQVNPRTCTSGRRGRVQALMCSLGVTDWFLVDNFDCSDDDLVLGMYPLRHVTEAAREMGAQFYHDRRESPLAGYSHYPGAGAEWNNASVSQIRPSGYRNATCCYNLPMSDQPIITS